MKSIGIVRRIDEMGRIVIPKEIRKTLRINSNDSIEIYIEGEEKIVKIASQFLGKYLEQ
jgi:transcriptional pleiotropic regulator of transition state genes